MKERLSVYLDPHVMRSLIDYADHRGKSKSLVAEAALARATGSAEKTIKSIFGGK